MPQCHPETIGRYLLSGVLGHGGMGTVYRARHLDSGRMAALKVLAPSEPLLEALGMPALEEIFAAEITTMAGLRHPNIVEVLESGLDHGRPFYVMEYLCANLGMMIGEQYLVEEPSRRVPPGRVKIYGAQILAGLGFMHAAGVIHRDIKPFNMLLTDDDTVRICDFGMARRQGDLAASAPAVRVGSPYYTAPEQLSNPDAVDGRADLFAAGVLLYRMLTGELPAMKGFMLSRVNPLFASAWDAFFAKALSWQPDLRFQTASDMALALDNLGLNQERLRPQGQARGGDHSSLRTVPLQVAGERAREAFQVNRLWQPIAPPAPGRLAERNDETVYDPATNLVWQRRAPDHPVDRGAAEELISALNRAAFSGLNSWRLPTVNELLSLAGPPHLPPDQGGGSLFPDRRDWFWSCDRRTPRTSWYVNTALGYAGWQDNGCRFSVRAVSSPDEP